MKKSLVVLLAVLLLAPAQGRAAFEPLPEREFSLHYSYLTGPEIALFFTGIFSTMFTLGHYSIDRVNCTGLLSAEYGHLLGNRWVAGGAVGYEYADLTFKDKNGNERPDNVNGHFISVMPTLKYYYTNGARFAMYAKAQVGALLYLMPDTGDDKPSHTDTDLTLGFQVSPVGLEFGQGPTRRCVEVGFGTQGFVSVGLKKAF